MDVARWQRVRLLFEDAVELEGASRADYLDRACGPDAALRLEVEGMIASEAGSSMFLVNPDTDGDVSDAAGMDGDPEGRRIGDFELVRLVATGGMGAVYEALQEHPRRRVALKMLRPGLTGPGAVARFQRESETLARLSHAGIAQVHEAGVHREEGALGTLILPWFAMEFVEEARDLAAFVEEGRPDARGRVGLFLKVCDAVHHAHQKGVIHRDLKPSNVLVGADGEPKVIDFGIALALAPEGSETTRHTRAGDVLGTLQYMSPEQLAGRPDDVDTRTDVYALGVILYELLCGRPPFDLLDTPLPEVVRTVQEEPPLDPLRANPGLDRDLGWILSKALEKEPERRYASASELAADLRRFLGHEPVVAGPPTAAYRLRKFVRRNRAGVTAALFVVLALLAGSTAATIGMFRARRAELREGLRAEEAEHEARKAAETNRFFAHVLTSFDVPASSKGELRMVDVLDHAAEDRHLADVEEPGIRAVIHGTMGASYVHLGFYEKALERFDAVLEDRDELGPRHREILRIEAAKGLALIQLGRLDEAETLLSGTRAACEETLAEDDEVRLECLGNLAALRWRQGRRDEASELYERLLEVLAPRVDMAGVERRLTFLQQLAEVRITQGRYADAAELAARAVDGLGDLLEETHPKILVSMSTLALAYAGERRTDEAVELYERVVAAQEDMLGADHPHYLAVLRNLGAAYSQERRYEEAERLLVVALDGLQDRFGGQHPDVLAAVLQLAEAIKGQGRVAETEPMYERALEICRATLPAEHPTTLACMNNLADVYLRQKRYAEQVELQEQVVDLCHRTMGPEHANTVIATHNLGKGYVELGRQAEAEPLLAEAVAGARTAFPAGHWFTGRFLGTYGRCLLGLERYEESEQALLEGHAILEASLGAASEHTANQRGLLALLYDAWGRPEEAAAWRER